MNPHWTIAEDIFLIKSIKANTVDYIILEEQSTMGKKIW